MVLISFTNIVVDDFHFGKRNPFKRYVYFLTHMHSDHYQGITNGWDHGQIFCSEITKALLLIKFPNIENVITLPMKTPTEIALSAKHKVTVTFLDANHCPGSVMILFQGFFGTVLHTGDMRFNLAMITCNPLLYPPERQVGGLEGCSLPIDELVLDNTYCDPIFKFPDRQRAFVAYLFPQLIQEMICEIIENHREHRVLICVDSVGKEELMVQLAEKFETVVVVSQQRFEMIQSINLRPELFSTNHDDGWIEVISKFQREERLKNKNCIAITATGWANITGYQMPDKQNFVIPYSLHSNFDEMHQFVRTIKPAILSKVVINRSGKSDKIRNLTSFSHYMVTLHHLKQRGFEFLEKQYTDLSKLSKEYSSLLNNPELQRQVQFDLGLILDDDEQFAANRNTFEEKHKNIFANKRKLNKGVKLKSPEHNQNFKITQFIKAKQQIGNLQKCKDAEVINLENSDRKEEIITTQKKVEASEQSHDQQRKAQSDDEDISGNDNFNFSKQKKLFDQKRAEVQQLTQADNEPQSFRLILKAPPKIIKATPIMLDSEDDISEQQKIFSALMNQKIANPEGSAENDQQLFASLKQIISKRF